MFHVNYFISALMLMVGSQECHWDSNLHSINCFHEYFCKRAVGIAHQENVCVWVLFVIRGRPKAEVLLSSKTEKVDSVGPKPSASLMSACQSPQATVPDADVDSAASFNSYLYIVSQYTVTPYVCIDSLHSLPPQLCTRLLATTKFINCSMLKPKVHRMWYDCFRPKPNVHRKCPFVHIRRRNRNWSRNSADLYSLYK